MTILICLAFYALGAISMGLFMVLMMAWHYARRPKPPTLRYRKHRGAAERRLSREGWEGIDYKWINIAGEEE